ncbi:MAG TPA: type II secretion system protein GspE [Chromatiales bacterium]|nr:type II secretion system protein GspE [Chromatiales bacterium]
MNEIATAVRDTAPHASHKPPYSFAKRHGLLVNPEPGDGPAVTVLYHGQPSPAAVAELRRFLGRPIALRPTSETEFDALLATVYNSGTGDAMAMMEDFGENLDLDLLAESLPEPEDLMESEDDAPIIRLINALLTEAVRENASDIHIETFESHLSVRFRVDGVLREVLRPPRNMGPVIVSRIKVMARLDIAEKRLPQDGRISLRVAGRAVDVRVSTLPSGHGERVVMRLLDKQAGRLNLSQLGMPAEIHEQIRQIIHKPHGIFLVTGPTGSGKTTTLYAALMEINDRQRNILTVEDPIEYFIDGIGQTQVNPKVDMTFARGLRAILRQDPDVVMVGEIRDLETAQIAVQASLTGHMVFSTLHTNTAVGAITRLRDMGVEPFLLSSSLVGVLAQRLVRLVCPECRRAHPADESEIQLLRAADPDLDEQDPPFLYSPVGCPSCNNTGYSGRSGIYELVIVDEEMRRMIHDQASEEELDRYARTLTPSIRAWGMRMVLDGRTTLEEVLRVTRED